MCGRRGQEAKFKERRGTCSNRSFRLLITWKLRSWGELLPPPSISESSSTHIPRNVFCLFSQCQTILCHTRRVEKYHSSTKTFLAVVSNMWLLLAGCYARCVECEKKREKLFLEFFQRQIRFLFFYLSFELSAEVIEVKSVFTVMRQQKQKQ